MNVINEHISVNLQNNAPTSFSWHGRLYKLTQVGLHHTLREGRTLVHVFGVTDGSTYFTLRFNTETLLWKLMEAEGGI